MAASGQRRPYPQLADSPSTASLLQSTETNHRSPEAAFAQGPRYSNTQSFTSSGSTSWNGSPTNQGVLDRRSYQTNSVSEKFSLPADPAVWGSNVSPDFQEPDDWIHNPDPKRDRKSDRGGSIVSYRGLTNLGCLVVLVVGLLALFAGYPIIHYFTTNQLSNLGGFNLGGINASGQVPEMIGNYGLIDADTPSSAHTYKSFADGSEWQLVFSDEFETPGRTFWPGDDPYWEAVDLHYWQTNDLEWYSPQAIVTKDGSLEITMSEKEINNLNYMSGALTTWNKFCFTGGMILVNVSLPGSSSVSGMWPAVWTMGNLGRMGYGASLDGLWPYVYDSCDVGTVANQTYNGGPAAALSGGDPSNGGALSYLEGQRLSRCTCPGESHPGPYHSDGTFVGRSAPEIDLFEAQVSGGVDSAGLSQSAQWAPMNHEYIWDNTTGNFDIADSSVTQLNSYAGGVYQQATSAVTKANPDCFDQNTGCYEVYGYEYQPGYKNQSGYISWVANGDVAWTLDAGGMVADPETEINDRPIPQEPMYIIANLAMSENFVTVDVANLVFPTTMRIDWVRVYQPKNAVNIGCDPKDYPTAAYIQQYADAYNNPNLTTWTGDTSAGGYGQTEPKNSFLGQC
ncbi:glycoside hydrolase family 16 protein [Coniophora puteana RWD-64-598 SS2]|uniref:Glycoside hydrolase family 16 protein n=1 Tax=Coniophora puteana (strain RWD-64-598) TaxID=741705 RepID=A0A5M3MI25_CONPW|nr:glycoside hydrolase family 16 protein [Coniophora puteana RWD-64-598 SS2]EIW78281.1 glycoside hydrolase family 16 protein [Coniophora puteana RWD-64-598 SS2]